MSDALRRFTSTKIVEAAPIHGYDADPSGRCTVIVQSMGGADSVIEVPRDFFAHGSPSMGDYYVRHADGYAEWASRRFFEESYREVAH